MNKHNAHQYLHLVQALADGKTIQLRAGCNHNWADKDDNILFNLDPECYRIKPEIINQEFYYIIHKDSTYGMGCKDLSKVRENFNTIDPTGKKYVIMHAKASSVESI